MARPVGQGRADDAETGATEQRFNAEIRVVVPGASIAGAGVGFYGGGAVGGGVFHRRGNQGQGDAAPAHRPAHRDAGDDPYGHIVNGRRGAGAADATQAGAGGHGNPAGGFGAGIGQQSGGGFGSGKPGHCGAAAAQRTFAGQGAHLPIAHPGVHTPAAGAEVAAEDDGEVVHQGRGQGMEG